MRRVLTAILILFGSSLSAGAVCTSHGTVGASSTQIVAAYDIKPRSYILIVNSGTTVGMWVAIGSTNAATTSDVYIKPGGSWFMSRWTNEIVLPSGDIAAISIGPGTTYAFCDF